jgi:hypothetical protein
MHAQVDIAVLKGGGAGAPRPYEIAGRSPSHDGALLLRCRCCHNSAAAAAAAATTTATTVAAVTVPLLFCGRG